MKWNQRYAAEKNAVDQTAVGMGVAALGAMGGFGAMINRSLKEIAPTDRQKQKQQKRQQKQHEQAHARMKPDELKAHLEEAHGEQQ